MTEIHVAILPLDVTLIIVAAKAAGRVATALGQPAVLGEIVAGVLAGPTLLNGAVADTLFPSGVRPYLGALADTAVSGKFAGTFSAPGRRACPPGSPRCSPR